jgi:hypothetical protein
MARTPKTDPVKAPAPKYGRGRPKLTPELEEELLELLASGKTLLQVCEDDRFPAEASIRKKALEDQEFGSKYSRAREIGYLRMADELFEIVDDGRNDWMTVKRGDEEVEVVNREAVERSKLRFQARQWLLSKALPKIYGDKLDVNAKHEAGEGFKALWAALGKQGALK